jgi:hypothetical protein
VLEERFGVSERRACRLIGQPRSTQRLPPPVPSNDELALRQFLRGFAIARPRWGWRRVLVAARVAGWRVNNKRIHRRGGQRACVFLSQAQEAAARDRTRHRRDVPDPAERHLGS